MNYAGIDVSYKEIVIVISVKGKARKAKTYFIAEILDAVTVL